MAITVAIPPQNFEVIRDKIAEIITTEFANQYAITGNDLFQAGIYGERFTAFDKTELPAVQVYFDRFEQNSKNADTVENSVYYNVVVYTKSKDKSTVNGDVEASKNCQKLLGVIRYILDGPEYFRINSPELSTVKTKSVESIAVGLPPKQGDGANTIAGLLTFKVDMYESNGVLLSEAIDGTDSTINEELKITINN